MTLLTNIILFIGNMIINIVTLITIGALMIGGLMYMYSFWGALPNRPVTIWDLAHNAVGVGLLLLALCVITTYLGAYHEYEEIYEEEKEEKPILALPSGEYMSVKI